MVVDTADTVLCFSQSRTFTDFDLVEGTTNRYRIKNICVTNPIFMVSLDGPAPIPDGLTVGKVAAFRILYEGEPLHKGWARSGCLTFDVDGPTPIVKETLTGGMNAYLSAEQNAKSFNASRVDDVLLEFETGLKPTHVTVTTFNYNVCRTHSNGKARLLFM